MTLNEKKANPDATGETDDATLDLPEPPHLPSPESIGKVEAGLRITRIYKRSPKSFLPDRET